MNTPTSNKSWLPEYRFNMVITRRFSLFFIYIFFWLYKKMNFKHSRVLNVFQFPFVLNFIFALSSVINCTLSTKEHSCDRRYTRWIHKMINIIYPSKDSEIFFKLKMLVSVLEPPYNQTILIHSCSVIHITRWVRQNHNVGIFP